jgi:FkbM family methyltransferase
MSDLAQRIAALSPEKLALLERQLSNRLGQAVSGAGAAAGNGNGSSTGAGAEPADSHPDLKQIQDALEEHPAIRRAAAVFTRQGHDAGRPAAYLVPEGECARPVLQILQLESEGRLSGRPRHELPDGTTVIHLNRNETEYVFREIFQEQSYLRHGISLPAGARVFDVGAHIGLFTLFVSRMSAGAEVYAFEPLPPIFDALQLNASIHGVNARFFEFGLGDREGAAEFSYYPHASVLSGRYADAAAERQTVKATMHIQQQLGVEATGLLEEEIDELLEATLITERFECPVKTLSQVIRENGVGEIDLLKIDVEKSEHDVLAGIHEDDWPKIRQVVVEVHDLDGRLERVARLLEGHGFKVAAEQDTLLRETNIFNVYAVRPAGDVTATAARSAPRPAWKWNSPEKLIQDVRQFAAERLPERLQPAALTLLHTLPLQPDGEVDHRALPPPEGPPSAAERAFVAPRTPGEQELAKLWAEVLNSEEIGIDDDFFASGGNWAQATQLISRIRQVFGVEFSPRDMPREATVANLAAVIAGRQSGSPDADLTRGGNHQGRALLEVDRFSDEDVNSFLSHLDTAEAAPEPSAAARQAAPETDSPRAYDTGPITRIGDDEQYDLLSNLDRLADEEVDSFLANIFTEEEVADAVAFLRSSAAAPDRAARAGALPSAAHGSPNRAAEPRVRTNSDATRVREIASTLSEGADVARLFELAYLTYARAVQEIGLEAHWETAEAYHAYSWDTHEVLRQGGDRSLLDEASQDYALSLEEADARSRLRFEEAYLNYLEEVREVWLRPGAEAVGPGSLAAIGRGMAMAANLAAGTLGRPRA